MMERLSSVDVLVVAARLLDETTDDVVESTDHSRLDVLVVSVRELLAGDGRPQRVSLAEAAATLFHGILTQRIFVREQASVALAVTLQLLAVNGWDVELEQPEEVVELVAAVRRGDAAVHDVAARFELWLCNSADADPERIRPANASRPQAEAKVSSTEAQDRHGSLRDSLSQLLDQHGAAVSENARLRKLLRAHGVDPDAGQSSATG